MFKANAGNSVVLNKGNAVTNQYAPLGAAGNFAEVFDSREEATDIQLRNYNIATWLGNYTLPGLDGARLAILGRLEWGIGGTTFQADFDWKMGTQLSVCASFIRVSAAFSEVGPGAPDTVRVGAMLSSGSRAARSQVTRSFPQLIFNSNSVVLFPIPPFAHALNLFSADEEFYDVGEVQIRYVAGASFGFSSTSTDLVSWVSDGVPFRQALATEDGVRFPETARFVELSSNTPDQDYHVTPCFTLSL